MLMFQLYENFFPKVLTFIDHLNKNFINVIAF